MWLHIMGSQSCTEAVFLLYSLDIFVYFPTFSKTTTIPNSFFCTFPLGALVKDVFLSNRCERRGGSRFALSWLTDASQQTVWEAVRLRMGTNLVFFRLWAKLNSHTVYYRQHHSHPVDPVKWQMRLHLLISKSLSEIHTRHNHTFTGFALAHLS